MEKNLGKNSLFECKKTECELLGRICEIRRVAHDYIEHQKEYRYWADRYIPAPGSPSASEDTARYERMQSDLNLLLTLIGSLP